MHTTAQRDAVHHTALHCALSCTIWGNLQLLLACMVWAAPLCTVCIMAFSAQSLLDYDTLAA